MTARKLTVTSNNQTLLCIPAYLRDKFGLQKGTIVDVVDNGDSIVITPMLG